jgi:hypothetical protein
LVLIVFDEFINCHGRRSVGHHCPLLITETVLGTQLDLGLTPARRVRKCLHRESMAVHTTANAKIACHRKRAQIK